MRNEDKRLENEKLRKRNITKPKKQEQKNYRAKNKKMHKNIKKLGLIVAAVATVAPVVVGVAEGIKIYNEQQIRRQAISYENQITDYNYELYDKIEDLEEDGLSKLSNEELRNLIEEVNENNYNAIKDKIAAVIPGCTGNLTIHRSDSSSDPDSRYSLKYNDKKELFEKSELVFNNNKIESKVNRYIDVEGLIKRTENGDIDRKELEEELINLKEEMKENADLGVYMNTKDGSAKHEKLKTYSISKNKKKIEAMIEKSGKTLANNLNNKLGDKNLKVSKKDDFER